MIYTKTPDKRKKISSSSEPHLTDNLHPDLLHSDPLKVANHVTETLQILRNVLERDYAAISKRLATGQSMMSVREPGTGSSIAHLAARCGDKAILKLLLRKYSDYTKMSNNNGRTAVHEAADHGKFVCLTYLLQHGAVCKTRDRSGITPLMLSAQKGHLQTLRRLALADPETMMCNDMNGYTALHHASSAGKEAAVRWLVEFGADDQTKDNEGNTAMHHAVTNNHLKCAIWLQHFSNCDVRQINNRGYNSCHIAAQKGHLCILNWLLTNHLLSPNEPGGKDGSTPVHVAAAHGQLDSLRCLKMYGANMHKKNFNDKTPKDLASSNKQHDCVRYLDTIKKPKAEKSQKRANSLTRIVQALSISGSEEKSPKFSGTLSKSKRKGKAHDKSMSDTESDTFSSFPCEKLNFNNNLNRTLPPPAPSSDKLLSVRRPRAGSFNSNRSGEEDSRSVYSNGSGSGVLKQNSWIGSGTKINRSQSNGEMMTGSPASSANSTGFDIMQVLRDEKRRQEKLRAADEDDRQSIRSGSSYNGTRGRSASFLSSDGTLDQGPSFARSPMSGSGYVPSPPPRSVSIDPSRTSVNSIDFDLRLGSPRSPGPEGVSVSDRSSLALSDSSGDSARPLSTINRAPCPIHRPTSPSRITTGDFNKVFSERQAARQNTRCTCRNSGEVILRDIPEQQRHMVASRSSNGSDYAMSPTGSGGSGVTTLRRQASELNRLNLDSFRSNWGTKTLTQPASSNIYSRSPVGTKPSPQSSNSTQNFGVSNGQCQGSPWINEYGSAEKNGIIFDENICNSKTYRDGTTFRTSTNLSDICKL